MAPKRFPPGIRLTAFGYATNARPMLCETTSEMGWFWAVAMKPRTEKTANPAKREYPLLMNPVRTAFLVMFVFSGR
jgi:hypothetical protein